MKGIPQVLQQFEWYRLLVVEQFTECLKQLTGIFWIMSMIADLPSDLENLGPR
jgi:hypothetical protein